MSEVNQRIAKLRNSMQSYQIDAYIVPSSDPHQSEYVAERWLSREWISGFSGSAGTVVVAADHAGLWTDSRYFLQAEQQLAMSDFELHKMENQFSVGYTDWLCSHLPKGSTVGIDGYMWSINQVQKLEKKLTDHGIELKSNVDYISQIWEERPALPTDEIFRHDSRFVTTTAKEKLDSIKEESSCDSVLLCALDDIAWALNLRGYDVEFNPVFIAYLVVGEDSTLFIDKKKVNSDIRQHLEEAQVQIADYNDIVSYLNKLPENTTISADHDICSYSLSKHINCIVKHEVSPARMLKAVKNKAEVEHIRTAMKKDGVALTKGFMWLENQLKSGEVSEYDFAMKLAEYRSQQAEYYGESFPAIIGYKSNGAIIHYRPDPESSAMIQADGVLLADSGGQYYDGTTDITRTIALGSSIDDEIKTSYTMVLKGMIALDVAVFPEGTYGGQLDILARQYLWSSGRNYLHGTGHGVGYFMNVHEPPQGFTAGPSSRSNTIMKVGMITSNEPGYYKDGAYGIRIENLIVTQESDTKGFLKHESLTMFPLDHKMMDVALLDQKEIDWIDDYHRKVYANLSDELNDEERAWLDVKCSPIKK